MIIKHKMQSALAFCTIFVISAALAVDRESLQSSTVDMENSCVQHFSRQTYTLHPKDNARVHEIHIRHNIKGIVRVQDSPQNESTISLDIDWGVTDQQDLENLQSNSSVFHTLDGDVFVVQLDVRESSNHVSYLVLGVIGCVMLVVLVGALLAWFIRKWRQSRTGSLNVSQASQHDSDEEEHFHALTDGHVIPLPSSMGTLDSTLDLKKRIRYRDNNETRINEEDVHMPDAPDTESSDDSQVDGPTGRSPAAPPTGLRMNTLTMATLTLMTVLSVVYAACVREYRADITIRVPRNIHIESISVFFNSFRPGELVADRWSHVANNTKLKIYDVADAGLVDGVQLCKTKHRCPQADAQNLAGCDVKTHQCVCKRGYHFTDGVCVDENECLDRRLDNCHYNAYCRNKIGSFECVCSPGYYGNGQFCNVCSYGCPSGQFIKSECNSTHDRVCSDCAQCDGPTYEAAPCGVETQDTLCIHAAQPFMVEARKRMPEWDGWYKPVKMFFRRFDDTELGFRVDASPNVFAENLHRIMTRENAVYVTDHKQSQDFFWKRESGLRVHIGVSRIQMVPEYNDVKHRSDNDYMLKNPHQSADQGKFMDIVANYCRNPVPSYYSITMEMMSDRTTAIKTATCDQNDPKSVKCPDDYLDGDKYQYRTLNDHCLKYGTFPETLRQVANSISCTAETPLLKLFNRTMAPEQEISFLSKDCQEAKSRCDSCIKNIAATCKGDGKCCSISCYYTPSCRKAQSPPCGTQEMECAMGDALRYTIAPVFENIKETFMCHVKYKPPETLYKFFYYVEIPEYQYVSPHKEVVVQNRGAQFHSSFNSSVDFINVLHDTLVPIVDEYMLVAHQMDGMPRPSFWLHEFKNTSEFDKKPIHLYPFSSSVTIMSAQVERPFKVSTSNWQDGKECWRRTDDFHSVQQMYRYDGVKVGAMLYKNADTFQYFVKSPISSPYIKFQVPGNQSIIYGYFKGKGIKLIYDDSLTLTLDKELKNNRWNITLKGSMSGCPAYLGIIVLETITKKQYFHQDAFISCPPTFTFTFLFPSVDYTIRRAFEFQLTDSEQTHKLFLSTVVPEVTNVGVPVDPLSGIARKPYNGSVAYAYPPPLEMEVLNVYSVVQYPPWPAIILVLIIFAALVVFLVLVYVYLLCTESYTRRHSRKATRVHLQRPVNGPTYDKPDDYARRHLSPRRRTIVACATFYGALRMFYNLIFTFTIFLAIVMAVNRDNIKTISDLPEFQKRADETGKTLLLQSEQYRDDELKRQQNLLHDMQTACIRYSHEISRELESKMRDVMARHHGQMYNSSMSIITRVQRLAADKLKDYNVDLKRFLENYNMSVSRNFDEIYTRYGRFLTKVYNNGWLSFSRKVHNNTLGVWKGLEGMIELPTKLKEEEVNFLSFLGVNKVEDIELIQTQFWQKFRSMLPDIRVAPVENADLNHNNCSNIVNTNTANNSYFFFETNSNFQEYLHRSLYHLPNQPKFNAYTTADDKSNNGDQTVYSYSFDTSLLFYIFLIFDAFLFMYRMWNTYQTIRIIRYGTLDKIEVSVVEIKHERLGNSGDNQVVKDIHEDEEQVTLQKDGQPTRPGRGPSLVKSSLKCIAKCLNSYILPKVLLAVTICCFASLVVHTTDRILTVNLIDSYDGFQRYAVSMDINQNLTNKYVSEQADYLNGAGVASFSRQMRQELRGLLTVKENFNLEQRQLLEEYKAEVCALHKTMLGNRTCVFPDLDYGAIEMDILPCAFLPVTPKPFTGYSRQAYLEKLRSDAEIYVTAARSLIFRTVYVGICFICCILTTHLIGSIYIYYLKSRALIPKRTIYQLPRPPLGLDTFGRRLPEFFPLPPPPPPPTAPKPQKQVHQLPPPESATPRIQLEGTAPTDVCESQV